GLSLGTSSRLGAGQRILLLPLGSDRGLGGFLHGRGCSGSRSPPTAPALACGPARSSLHFCLLFCAQCRGPLVVGCQLPARSTRDRRRLDRCISVRIRRAAWPDSEHRNGASRPATPHLESSIITGQGRQESNPQPAVLETAALPIE